MQMSLVCVMMSTSHIKALSNRERSRHHERKKTGYGGRYRQHRQENDALPALRQTERTEGKREEKHTETTGTAHAVIERGQAGC